MWRNSYSERFCLSRTARVKSAPVEQFALLIWMYCLAERQREGSVVSPPEVVGGCMHARHEATRVRYSRFPCAESNGEFCRVEPPFNEVTTILRCIQSQCRVHEAIEKTYLGLVCQQE